MRTTDTQRRTQAFCIGQAKAGTASLVGLLAACRRVTHEPERARTLDLILREARGELDAAEVRELLAERDARLDLEIDVAWANQFLLDHLLAVFPHARFVVLVRDCFTWVESFVGHLVSRDVPQDVLDFLPFWFRPGEFPATAHDRALIDAGLYPVAAYLAAWTRHVDVGDELVPPGRRLVLYTHRLRESHAELATFLGMDEGDLDAGSGHRNRSTWPDGIETLVPREHLEETARAVCAEAMARHFPEVTGLEDARGLWARA